MNVTIEQVKTAVERLLTNLYPDALPVEVSEEGENEYTITCMSGGVGLDYGWPVDVGTLSGFKKVPGYRVWYMKESYGNRWTPPDAWDVTVLETMSLSSALEKLALTVVMPNLQNEVRIATAEVFEDNRETA